jgi:hypothetical protein
MKLALFGATGVIGQRILDEALRRGHQVTAIQRDPSKLAARDGVIVVQGSILDPESVAATVAGHDAVISAFGPGHSDVSALPKSGHSLIEGLSRAGVSRLVVVGGAGSLEVAPGVTVLQAGGFPEEWRPLIVAHAELLDLLKKDAGGVDWTYFSPAALIAPGERTGVFRLGSDELVKDSEGNSRISAEDYAIALLDEVEEPKHVKGRFAIGY